MATNLPRVLLQGIYYPDDISITVNEASHRKIDPELESKIINLWDQRVREAKDKGVKVWDSSTYRLNAYAFSKKKLSLELSTIDFSVRNTMRFVPEVAEMDEEYYSKGLFVASIIKTSDEKYIFGELSGNTMNHKKVDFIGGVASHDELVIAGSKDLFSVLYKELEEETGIRTTLIKDCYIRGLVLTDGYTVGALFFVTLNISCGELLQLFSQYNDQEMKSLVCVDGKDLKSFVGNIGGYGSAVAEILK